MKSRAEMPFVLDVLMGCATGYAAFSAIILAGAVVNLGSFSINGLPVSGREFLFSPWILVVLLPGVASAFVAFGLWHERLWGRDALMGTLVGYALLLFGFNLVVQDFWRALTAATRPLIYILPLGLYLFGKQSVNDYYQLLVSKTAQVHEPTARSDA